MNKKRIYLNKTITNLLNLRIAIDANSNSKRVGKNPEKKNNAILKRSLKKDNKYK